MPLAGPITKSELMALASESPTVAGSKPQKLLDQTRDVLPPYVVFCASNANVAAHGLLTLALIANVMFHRSVNLCAQKPMRNAAYTSFQGT
jgi:hypothetical protein